MTARAVNGRLLIDDTDMDYIAFGRGGKALVMIPGIGDGLKTVKGTAIPFAFLYRALAAQYRVYAFSRRNRLPVGFTTRQMAADIALAMERLDMKPAAILGVSLGGMIAQYLAIDHPERVEKLILAVTLARPNDTLRAVINGWTDMARAGDYRGIMADTAEKSYSEAGQKKARRMYAMLGNMGKPESFDRFLVQADACLSHDAYGELGRIHCPTLVIGGADDRIVTGEASREIAERIPGSELYLYAGLGHAAYEEAKDFTQRVLAFCGQSTPPCSANA